MPNWTWNKITCKKNIGDKILTKTEDGYSFNFNKLIPMPESLKMSAGSIEDKAVASYFLSLDELEKVKVKEQLLKSKLPFYGSYWNKYQRDINDYINNPDKLKEERKTFNGGAEDGDKDIKDLNELGKKYIDNINNHGYSQWYDWCNEKWGTKWNVDDEVEVDYDSSTEKYEICFNTAWNPPYGIIEEYSKLCGDNEFDWEYMNDDYDGHHYLTKENNKIIDRVVDNDNYYKNEEDMEI